MSEKKERIVKDSLVYCRDCDGCTICIRCNAPPNHYTPGCDICRECRKYNLKKGREER